jgi:hypothetical protein
VVPVGTPDGETVKMVPLQVEVSLLETMGTGLTVATIVKLDPTQLPEVPDVGVTVYVKVALLVVVLVNV